VSAAVFLNQLKEEVVQYNATAENERSEIVNYSPHARKKLGNTPCDVEGKQGNLANRTLASQNR
jgi:hypothetical protein